MIIVCLIALVRFHVFVYIWVNYMIVIIELCFTSVYGEKKSVSVAIRKTSSKTTTVTRSYTKDQVNIKR